MENGVIDEIARDIEREGAETAFLESIVHEPEVADVDRVAARVRGLGLRHGDFILAIGGGGRSIWERRLPPWL